MKNISSVSIKQRLLWLLVIVIFVFSLLICRLFYVQVVDSDALTARATTQWARDLPLKADRGIIYDASGKILASNQTLYDIYVRPNSLVNAELVAKKISAVLNLDYDAIYKKVSKKGTSEVTIVKQIDKNAMLALQSEGLKGLYFGTSSARYYPYGNYMTAILGFTDADNKGQTGIEAYYNQYLSGTDGQILTETDLVGKELDGTDKTYIPSVAGMDVTLTLDYQIQSLAERATGQAMLKNNANGALCMVMNPKTGAIYAMSQTPSFDLNDQPRDDLEFLFANSKNRFATDVYEPGSTFKILTTAIGLTEIPNLMDRHFFCPGHRIVDGNRIKCWKSLGHGSQTFTEGVANSCNCVFMDIALAVGKEKMYAYFEKFGVTSKTGLDVTGEAKALMLKKESVKNVDLARIGFGQAIAVTPIGLACAVSAIINGGVAITPHIVAAISGQDGAAYTFNGKPGGRVVSEKVSRQVRSLLEGVVTNGGGKNAGVYGYSIGGKTGTAQKYSASGGIAQGKYISSFIGFTGADNPEYLVMMIVDEPKGYEYYGSLVAAPLVAEVFDRIFKYKQIKPVYGERPVSFTMPDLIGIPYAEAFKILKQLGLHYEYDGGGGVVKYQLPAAGAATDTNGVAFVQLEY